MEAEKSKRKPVVDMNAGLYTNYDSVSPKRANTVGKLRQSLVPSRAFHSLHVPPRMAWLTSCVFPPFVPQGYLLSQLRTDCMFPALFPRGCLLPFSQTLGTSNILNYVYFPRPTSLHVFRCWIQNVITVVRTRDISYILVAKLKSGSIVVLFVMFCIVYRRWWSRGSVRRPHGGA